MLKNLTIWTVVGVFSIFTFVSLFPSNNQYIGSIGQNIQNFSLQWFGVYAYVLYPSLFLLVNSILKEKEDKEKKTLLFIFFSMSAIVITTLITNENNQITNTVNTYLTPYLGVVGVGLLSCMTLTMSFLYFYERQSKQFFENILNIKEKKEEELLYQKTIKEINQRPKPKKLITPKKVNEVKEDIVNKKEEVKEERITLNDSNIRKIIKEEKPTPVRREEIVRIRVEEDLDLEQETNGIDNINNELEQKSSQREEIKNFEVVKTLEENEEQMTNILEEKEVSKTKNQDFTLPFSYFFQKAPEEVQEIDEAVLEQRISELLEKLKQFKIEGDVIRTYSGPVVTTFEFKPAPNVKVSKILNLQDDLAMVLKAQTIRIQAPIPGKDVVGIEVPNESFETIYFRDMLESEVFENSNSPLTMILGKDIVGNPYITDLKKLPHLLIAGTTGSGKSVGINSMILSLLYKNSPEHLKLIMIDPKMLEFSMYNDIPHLLTPVITEAKSAINALSNMVKEMERRYRLMADTKTKNIENFNEKAFLNGEEQLPYIVIVIDELADLMMTSGKDVELSIARLAQMARASGIHLIVATQRPSVDVVTGLIKANLPSRISYKVGQRVDSKIILDELGAESLLGRGDLLFTPPGSSSLVRVHAPWTTETEIEKVVDFIKAQREPEYDKTILKDEEEQIKDKIENGSIEFSGELDEMYEEAKKVILTDKKTSISYLQRRLRIGYNRAASIIEQLEQTGVLSEPNAKGIRQIN